MYVPLSTLPRFAKPSARVRMAYYMPQIDIAPGPDNKTMHSIAPVRTAIEVSSQAWTRPILLRGLSYTPLARPEDFAHRSAQT